MANNTARSSGQAGAYTHLWRSQGGDIPCSLTGEPDPPQVNGQAFTQVRTPDGTVSYVPKDQLILRPARPAKKAAQPIGLSPADAERLTTWMLDIADEMLGERHDEADGSCRFGANRSLVIHPGGLFHNFVTGKGGVGGIALLAMLHEVSVDGAVQWARAWLDNHSGVGGLADSGDQGTRAADDAEHVAFIAETWKRTVEIRDTAGWAYLASRGLVPSDDDLKHIRWLPHARGIGPDAEGAMVVALVNNSAGLEALQLTYVTAAGAKSTIQPCRRTYRGAHDWSSRGAFRFGSDAADLVLVEGVEDALTAAMAGAERVHACLGANAIGMAELPPGVAHVTVARDDDPPGSPASLALGRGVAHLMLQGRSVAITPRAGTLAAGAKDLNDLLKIDIALVQRMLEGASGVKVRLDAAEKEAFLDEVAQAATDAYENNRKAIADALGWRASALDQDRSKRRQAWAQQANLASSIDSGIIDPEPSPDPVTDIGAVLNEAVKEIGRFLIVPDPTYLDTVALWSLHTHALHNPKLKVSTTGRLAFQSPVIRCGKSTGLKCASLLSHKARMASSITPASLFRAIEDEQVSIMVDEADNLFKKHVNPDLVAILNSGIDRMTAFVMRTVPVGDNHHKTKYFRTFTGVAFTSVRQLPIDSVQDRVIALHLKRAKKDERPERLTIETREGLIEIGRKFARWTTDLVALPKLDRSGDLYNRIEDKWCALFQIAELAGADWLRRCRAAALTFAAKEEAADAEGGRDTDLLAAIWQVFYEQVRDPRRLHTKELCRFLNEMDEAPWAAANKGRGVDDYHLKTHLRGFLPDDPEAIAARKWRDPSTGQARGYHELHFEDAFDRYLGRKLPSETPNDPSPSPQGTLKASVPSVHPSHSAKSAATSNTKPVTDAPERIRPIRPKTRPEQASGTDGTETKKGCVPENDEIIHGVKSDWDGWTDGTDALTPLRGSIPPFRIIKKITAIRRSGQKAPRAGLGGLEAGETIMRTEQENFDRGLRYFAFWHIRKNYAGAVDVYLQEVERHRPDYARYGQKVAGPFDSQREALNYAMAEFKAARPPSRKGRAVTLYGCPPETPETAELHAEIDAFLRAYCGAAPSPVSRRKGGGK